MTRNKVGNKNNFNDVRTRWECLWQESPLYTSVKDPRDHKYYVAKVYTGRQGLGAIWSG